MSDAPRLSPLALGLVALAHVAVLALLVNLRVVPVTLPLPPLMVSLVTPSQPPESAPEIVPPRPKAVARRERPLPEPSPPVLAAETSLPAPLPEVERIVEPTPLPPIAAPHAPPQPAAPAPVAPPRFDADYLDNPKPAYPPLSRRIGEEGKVVLRVFVEASGLPSQVEVRTSSGSERLDRAAVSAVGRWRFVPARQGSEAVAAWVLVPIVFSLKE